MQAGRLKEKLDTRNLRSQKPMASELERGRGKWKRFQFAIPNDEYYIGCYTSEMMYGLTRGDSVHNDAGRQYAQLAPIARPIFLYLMLSFGIAWVLWMLVIKALHGREELLNYGVSAPAIAGLILSASRMRAAERSGLIRWAVFVVVTAADWVVISLFYNWRGGSWPIWRFDPLLAPVAMLPAWVVSCAWLSDTGVRGFARRIVHAPTRWTWVGPIGLIALQIVPAFVVHLCGGTLVWPGGNAPVGQQVAKAGLFFAYNLLFVGLLEEPGWRGFLLDKLQLRFTPLVASLMVWLPWAAWHAPLDLYRPVRFSLVVWILLRVVFMIAYCILMAWLYNRSGRSIQATVMFHATMNTAPFVLPYSPPAMALIFVWMAYAIVDGKMWRRGAMARSK